MPPLNLEREAARVAQELGQVVFIGAVAVNHYAELRTTMNIDLVLVAPVAEDRLRELGYRKKERGRNSWYTPRGIQADSYTKDVGRIPVGWIVRTSVQARVGRRAISVISLEGLVLAKHRAGRPQDIADPKQLMTHRGREVGWDLMGEVGASLEVSELKQAARALGSCGWLPPLAPPDTVA